MLVTDSDFSKKRNPNHVITQTRKWTNFSVRVGKQMTEIGK